MAIMRTGDPQSTKVVKDDYPLTTEPTNNIAAPDKMVPKYTGIADTANYGGASGNANSTPKA